jgi:hypothetical protein
MATATGNVNALQSVFSGADVVVIFGDQYIGECMSFTVGVNREAGPLYTMGRKEPIAIPKGKRGIGGSFILAQLGYDALLRYYSDIMGDAQSKPIWVRRDESLPITEGARQDGQVIPKGMNQADLNATIEDTKNALWENIVGQPNSSPNYVDQMPPFNATIVGVNEQGNKMGFRVYGISIINEGMALSIEELNMEKRYTFIAQAVSKMTPLA